MFQRIVAAWVACLLLLLLPWVCLAQSASQVELARLLTQAEERQKAGDSRAAIQAYERALPLASQIFGPNHVNAGAILQATANLYREAGDLDRAEKLYERCVKIFETGDDPALLAEGLNNLANVRWDQGKYLESQGLYERSLQIMQRQYGENSPATAIARNNLAGVYKALGQYAQAEPLYRRGVSVLEQHRSQYTLELADALGNLADLYMQQGELARAEPLFERSVQLKESKLGPDRPEVARSLSNLAALHASMGQYADAQTTHERVLTILERTLGPDHQDVARSLVNLASVHVQQKNYDKAEPLYARALAIREARLGENHPDVALTLHNFAGLYTAMGRADEAQKLYERSLRIRETALGKDHLQVAHSLYALGRLRLEQRQYAEAEELFDRSLIIRERQLAAQHPDLAHVRSVRAVLYAATQRPSEAAAEFDRARRGFRQYADQVLPALSEAEQLTFLKEIDEANYHVALSLAWRRREDEQVAALSAGWALNGKAVAQQTLAHRALMARDTTNPIMAAVAKSLLALRKQLASLSLVSEDGQEDPARRERVERLAAQEKEQSRQLARISGRGAGTSEWIELDRVRAKLPDDAVLIEIARFATYDFASLRDKENRPERYLAWIIPAPGDESVRVIDLGDANEIDAAVKEARTALQQAPARILEVGEPDAEKELREVLAPLAKRILYPLTAEIGETQNVYLSPDSRLWLVPWGALPLESGEYAIERYRLRYLVSGRDLAKNEGQFTPGRPIMFADPNYDLAPAEVQAATQTLFRGRQDVGGASRAAPAAAFKLGVVQRLPGTKVEAEAVRPKLEGYAQAEPYVYTDRWALEAVFKSLRQPRVLVVSTHGFFQDERGAQRKVDPEGNAPTAPTNPLLRCGLLLAGCNKPLDLTQGDGEDGILTGLEIVGADLRGTELVVLSACETGLGEVRNGEGVAGLRQAFQLAGAQAVIATLWQIPDRETARLMSDFFGRLAETGEKAESLRAAQLALIEARRDRNEAAHPFFWAAFTLTGE